nr:hypothetical protein [Tanacetum cinerariifolium]
MSSNNAQSAVTYTSISSNSDEPSWGIPLMNAGDFPEMDPYEEVVQQGQTHPLSPAYVPDPIELDEHVHVHVLEPEHPEYHAPSDDDIQVEDQPHADDASPTAESPGYIDDSDSMEEDDDEDPEEDPNEEHEPEDDDEDPEKDPNEEHEPEDEDTREPSEDSDETEPFEEDETAVTPSPPRHRGARISVRPQTPVVASTQALIDAFVAESSLFPLPPTNPAYDQTPLESFAAAARAPRSQYDFVNTIEAGHGLIRSPSHDARTIFRAADRAEDVGYVRALQASERRMITSIEEVNLRVSYQAQVRRQESKYFYTQLHDAQTNRRDIRLEIDVVKGQMTAYETELQEVHQAFLSSEARNRALLVRLKTLKTHVSRMEWQRQSTEDLTVTQMMRIHTLEARAQTDTVEDADSIWIEGIFGLSQWLKKMESVFHISGCTIDNQNENKRRTDDSSRNNQQQPHKKQNVARAYTAGPGEKKVYTGDLPLCTKYNYHHTGQCASKCGKCKRNSVAQGRAYALGGRDASPNSNVITGTFILNNRYTKILFDTGADRSFVSITFSALINITPTTLENHYDVELADGKIYHGVIIRYEKMVRVPFGREMLIFQGNGGNQREESRFNIISCTKAQEYFLKGYDVFLAPRR